MLVYLFRDCCLELGFLRDFPLESNCPTPWFWGFSWAICNMVLVFWLYRYIYRSIVLVLYWSYLLSYWYIYSYILYQSEVVVGCCLLSIYFIYKGGDAYCFTNGLSMVYSLDVLSYLLSLLLLQYLENRLWFLENSFLFSYNFGINGLPL